MEMDSDYFKFKENEVIQKIVRMIQKIMQNSVLNDILLFYAKYLALVFCGEDYMSSFMKPLSCNFLTKIHELLEESVLGSLHPSCVACFHACCVNYSRYLQEWYVFQKTYCSMVSNLCVISAKICKDYIYISLKHKKETKHSVFTDYSLELQEIIRDLVGEMCLFEEQAETKKKVEKIFEKYAGSDQFFLREMQEYVAQNSGFAVDFSSRLEYIKGLIRELHLIKDGKVVDKEEIQFMQRVLTRI